MATKKEFMKADVRIEFRPKWVRYECPYCGYEEEMDYEYSIFSEELCEDIREVHCFNCHKDFDLDDLITE